MDVKPETVAALQEGVGPFLESSGIDEAGVSAACTALFAKLGLGAKKKGGKAAGAGAATAGASTASADDDAAAAGAGSSTRKLGGAVTLSQSVVRRGDDDLMAFLWGKDTSDRSVQFNQSAVLGDPDAKAMKKAARLAKKEEDIAKRMALLAETEEMSAGPVVTGGADTDLRTQVSHRGGG